MAEGDYFKQALGDFIRNFAYGDEIKKLVKRGYDTDRIVREMAYPLSPATIDKMVQKAKAELESEAAADTEDSSSDSGSSWEKG
ncbi:MAG: hypothetical protein IKR47_01405 [Lachnospiraceae bacterium]|nr:hypothetical protein [Lachnospiraceae bacterium]